MKHRSLSGLVALIVLSASIGTVHAAPSRPTNDDMVLATLPKNNINMPSELRTAQASLAADPTNLAIAVATARMNIELGRQYADPRHYGMAQAALKPWWSDTNPPDQVRLLRAVIFQAFHDFDAALADLDAVLLSSPGNAQARLSRAFVRMVTGDISGAAEDCSGLPRRLDALIMDICRSRIDALSGSNKAGFDRLQNTVMRNPSSQPSMQEFALAIMADMAISLGKTNDAEQLFKRTLDQPEPDVSVLAAYADLLLDLGRPADVLNVLDNRGSSDILVLRRAIAAKRLGDPALADWSRTLSERFSAAKAGGVRIHLREEARFRLEVLGESQQALELALENWKIQKEPADARLLIETAQAAGKPEEAQPVINHLSQTGLSDARISYVLGQLVEQRQ